MIAGPDRQARAVIAGPDRQARAVIELNDKASPVQFSLKIPEGQNMGLINEQNDEQMVERLAGKAGNIIAMLRSVLQHRRGWTLQRRSFLRRALQAMPVTKQSVRSKARLLWSPPRVGRSTILETM